MNTPDNTDNPGKASVDSFFNDLDKDVNGIVLDDNQTNEATLQQEAAPIMDNLPQSNEAQTVDWEKRYKDSSREAVMMRDELKDIKPFVPILDAMKKDRGLVNHVRGYFENGGEPAKTVKEQLGLDEDFIYDQQEALDNPDSDSGKVFSTYVDRAVQQKMGAVLANENKKREMAANKQQQIAAMGEFIKRRGLTKEQFTDFMETLKNRKPTLDDLYDTVYRDKANSEVAKNVRTDMMEQMKNVRDIPTSVSGVNSPRAEKSADDQIFDDVMGSGLDMNDLFGN